MESRSNINVLCTFNFDHQVGGMESKIWALDLIAKSIHLEIFLKFLVIPSETIVVEFSFDKVVGWSPGEIS